MRPMPVNLLLHAATLYDVEMDDYQHEYDKIAAVLERIRIEPSQKIIVDANGADVQCAATLFYDNRSSLPHGVYFKVGQAVFFDGERYRVADVQSFYDGTRMHHQEVTLIDA